MSYTRNIRIEGDLVKTETLRFFNADTDEEIDDVIAFAIQVYADGRYTMVDIERPVGEKCPSASFWETWKLVSCAEARLDGSFKLPHQKYFEEHPKPDFSMSSLDLVDALKRNDCHTCKNRGKIVDFNVERPCPDCTT